MADERKTVKTLANMGLAKISFEIISSQANLITAINDARKLMQAGKENSVVYNQIVGEIPQRVQEYQKAIRLMGETLGWESIYGTYYDLVAFATEDMHRVPLTKEGLEGRSLWK